MDLLLVLLTVVAPVYLGTMALLALGLCRAAKRGDELELLSGQAARAAALRDVREPRLAVLSGRR